MLEIRAVPNLKYTWVKDKYTPVIGVHCIHI